MKAPQVYLHIPKSAGTAHRTHLQMVYGESKVLWYGINSDAEKYDPSEADSYMAVGGHKPIRFYPPSLKPMYTSVVREPIERAVSFFNYSTEEPRSHSAEWTEIRAKDRQKWIDSGVDPESLFPHWSLFPSFCFFSYSQKFLFCKK